MVSREQAGVCCDGVAPKTLSHIYKVAIQPILTYGCSAINITPGENSRHTSENGPWSTKEPQKLPTVRCPWNRKDRSTHQETATHSIKKCTAG